MPFSNFVFLEDLKVSNVSGYGIDLQHAAHGLHRVAVESVLLNGDTSATGIRLTQTFGRSWGSVSVRDVDGVCMLTRSARGRVIDLDVSECRGGGLKVEQIGALRPGAAVFRRQTGQMMGSAGTGQYPLNGLYDQVYFQLGLFLVLGSSIPWANGTPWANGIPWASGTQWASGIRWASGIPWASGSP